jgi:hypothetical protein
VRRRTAMWTYSSMTARAPGRYSLVVGPRTPQKHTWMLPNVHAIVPRDGGDDQGDLPCAVRAEDPEDVVPAADEHRLADWYRSLTHVTGAHRHHASEGVRLCARSRKRQRRTSPIGGVQEPGLHFHGRRSGPLGRYCARAMHSTVGCSSVSAGGQDGSSAITRGLSLAPRAAPGAALATATVAGHEERAPTPMETGAAIEEYNTLLMRADVSGAFAHGLLLLAERRSSRPRARLEAIRTPLAPLDRVGR